MGGKIVSTIDLKREYKGLYTAKAVPAVVEVPPRLFLMIDGEGDPNGEEYANAAATLYPVAYGVRKVIQERFDLTYKVMPLEGLWWADDLGVFARMERENWKWSSILPLPPEADAKMVVEVIEDVVARKSPPSGDRIRVELFTEGKAMQVLHRGPYSEEPPTIERLHLAIEKAGYRRRGKHHEIYLTDPRRSAPEKNRTIIRHPIVEG